VDDAERIAWVANAAIGDALPPGEDDRTLIMACVRAGFPEPAQSAPVPYEAVTAWAKAHIADKGPT
jgi:hypothetical protein